MVINDPWYVAWKTVEPVWEAIQPLIIMGFTAGVVFAIIFGAIKLGWRYAPFVFAVAAIVWFFQQFNLQEKNMKFEDITFYDTVTPTGIQGMKHFGDYQLSIVKSDFSYGGKQGLYEIAVFKDHNQVELPGITEPGDTVKGFLNESEVEVIMKKMQAISGQIT